MRAGDAHTTKIIWRACQQVKRAKKSARQKRARNYGSDSMLATSGKALIFVVHQITRVTNACQSSVSVCLNVTCFGCQTVIVHRMDILFGKMDQNDQNVMSVTIKIARKMPSRA